MSTENLPPAEQILWSGRPSHWYFFGQWVAGVVITAALIAGLYFLNDTLRRSLPEVLPWIYVLPAVVFALFVLSITTRRASQHYSVTPKRVILLTGLLAKSSNEIRIQDIRSINVRKSGIGGLFGIGNVEFSSAAADDADVIFFQVSGADGVRDLVRKLQS